MTLTPAQRDCINRFRDRFEGGYSADPRFGKPVRDDRGDGSVLASRFPIAEKLWMEVYIRPFIPQVRVGIMTDDRWLSEDLEQVIEDSGDSMSEFVELGFDEAGLTWRSPVVQHAREEGKYFYFATALDLKRLEDLSDETTFDKIRRMFEGYYEAFKPGLKKTAPLKP